MERYLKTKLKLYNVKIRTKFYNNNEEPTKPHTHTQKKNSPFCYYYIPAIALQSVCKIRKQDCDKYYPQIYLGECLCAEKKSKKIKIRRKSVVSELKQ